MNSKEETNWFQGYKNCKNVEYASIYVDKEDPNFISHIMYNIVYSILSISFW